jgi:hypothetical protein
VDNVLCRDLGTGRVHGVDHVLAGVRGRRTGRRAVSGVERVGAPARAARRRVTSLGRSVV